jgi:hypothetical protein
MATDERSSAAADQPVALRGSRRKRLLRRLLGILCGLAFGFLLAEVGLRAVGIEYPRTATTDPYRGTAFIPGISFRQSSEGDALIEINKWGFRDIDRTLEKPPGVFRIAVLGDSYTDALQVGREARFTELLEQDLNSGGCFAGTRVEVLNFGRAGYGTVQEFMTLRHSAWRFDPDLVIVAFLTGNDLRNNSSQLQNDPGRPYFRLKGDGLEFDDSFRKSSDYVKTGFERLCYTLIDYSRVLQVLNRVRKSIEKQQARNEALHNVEHAQEELGLDSTIYREPNEGPWREAWDITERILVLMKEEVEEHDAEFLVVTLSNAAQVNPDERERREFMEQLGVETLFYPDLRLKKSGETHGFDVLNLAPIFHGYAMRHDIDLHGFSNTKMGTGHWNENGHELAAKTIAEFLCGAGDIQPP